MAREVSLNDLGSIVRTMAGDTAVIKNDVGDIKNAIMGAGGIRESMAYIAELLEKQNKKGLPQRLRDNRNNLSKQSDKITKNTNSIVASLKQITDELKNNSNKPRDRKPNMVERLLGKISSQISGLSKRQGGLNMSYGDRRQRLSAANFRRVKDSRYENLSQTLDITQKLQNVKLKDIILGKTKLKHLRKIMSRFLNMFRKFKDNKEVEETISFANASIDLMKKLAKVGPLGGVAKLGVKAIDRVMTGDKKGRGGLLGLFAKVSVYKKEIKQGTKSIKDMEKSTGSMFIITLSLAGIAVLAIPAMVGALLMKGVVWLMIGTFKALSAARRPINRGSSALLKMSTSIIVFALGLGLMVKAVRNMKLKDVGLMIASIAGISLTMAGVGLLAAPIALGSATILLLSASLGLFGLAIIGWQKIDSKKAMGNVKEAIGGLREALGIELGKHDQKKNVLQRIGGGIIDMAMSFINAGSMFFMMGTLLMAGISLGILYHGLKRWDNFDGKKAAANIGVAVGALKDVFGLNEVNGGPGTKLKATGTKLMDLVTSVLQAGGALVQMGTIMLATMMSDVIRVTLIPWNKYDARPAAANLKIAVDTLKDVFGLGKNMGNGFFGKIGKLVGGALDMGTTLMQAGSTLAEMGTIMLAVGMSDVIKLELKAWDNYDPTNSIKNMSTAIHSLNNLFGLNIAGQGRKVSLVGGLFEMGSALLSAGGTLAQMGTIAMATGMLSRIQENLEPWRSYDSSKPIASIKTAIDGLLNTFGMGAIKREEDAAQKNKGLLSKISGFFKNIADDFGRTVTAATDSIASAAEGGAALTKITNLSIIMSVLNSMKKSLQPWDSYDPTQTMMGITKAVTTLTKNALLVNKYDPNGKVFKYFETASKRIKNGLFELTNGVKESQAIHTAIVPFKKTVDIVNSVDIEKASVMIELFKSFTKIKENKPFDKFTSAVKDFSESCSDLIDALNNFSENYSTTETESGEQAVEKASAVKGSVKVTNMDDLAKAIAEAIQSLPVNIENHMSDIRLVVNNETGRRVILTLDN